MHVNVFTDYDFMSQLKKQCKMNGQNITQFLYHLQFLHSYQCIFILHAEVHVIYTVLYNESAHSLIGIIIRI